MNLDCILSFTTWKGRIYDHNVMLNLMSMLSQKTHYNYKVVLVLSSEEFPNKEKQIPEDMLLISRECPQFEILWTYRNTRALKKLNPVMRKYPDIPIMTTDDDILLKDSAIEQFMNEHQKTPDMILTNPGFVMDGNEVCTGCFRLFPPHSLAELDDEDFMTYYQGCEDDAWNALRAILGRTHTRIITEYATELIENGNQRVALANEYHHIPWKERQEAFFKAFPEARMFFDRLVHMKNMRG